MQQLLSKLFSIFTSFISVSSINKILLKLKGYWQGADVSGKLLITVFFAPSLFVLFWLLFDVVYIIVFTLPGIVIKILAQIFLFCVFWCAAVYFYEKLYGVMSEKVIDCEQTESTQNVENNETENKKNRFKWRRKNSGKD